MNITNQSSNFESFVKELIKIGSTPFIKNGVADESYFWRPEGEGVGPFKMWDSRTREIGIELYKLGGNKIQKMIEAHEQVVSNLGSMAGHALSAHWNNIGEEEWQQGLGESWMH